MEHLVKITQLQPIVGVVGFYSGALHYLEIKNMNKALSIFACIISMAGYFLPFLSDQCSSHGERIYKSIFELGQAGPFVFIYWLWMVCHYFGLLFTLSICIH
ncbi:hypothetical protein [Zooshikella harenae]|uniref:Uncharacterized protein n=1 Tax=Zooshikella harenae TaxID=2827238 RepID=A0ABS5ZIT3_9GAMM|nr:hypothetical protein [Zooshikella harenae]MBU2713994.1 hypothetical protein [Zooshikella harenae]